CFFSSRRRHTRFSRDWSSDVCSSDLIGVMVGGSIAILLFVKESLHGFKDQLKDKDLTASMTFAGISLIILPILPDQDFGPYSVRSEERRVGKEWRYRSGSAQPRSKMS